MKVLKLFLCVLCSIQVALASASALANPKIDSFIKTSKLRKSAVSYKALSMKASVKSEDSEMVEVFIKSSDPESTKSKIKRAQGWVHTSTDSVITASIASDSLESIAESEEVQFIEGGKPIGKSNDKAAIEINAGEVSKSLNLPEGYTGEGVIIGIIDTGIDYSHADFKDAEGRSRIISIWNQMHSGGKSPSEIENSFGTECDSDSIADGSCPLADSDGHGTHVAATAAGSDETYRGIAPDANIIVVSYDSSVSMDTGYAKPIFSTKICQAAYYIFKKADSLGMPAVINLSLGTHIGSHDGSSLFESCLSELLKDSAGRAIVAAAGNEYTEGKNGFTGIHVGGEISETTASNFVIRRITSDRIYYIDLWGSKGSDLSVGLAFHNGRAGGTPEKFSGLVEMGASSSGSFLDGKINYVINFTEESSALNGKPHAGIRIMVDPSLNDISRHSFDLVVSGNGSYDAWLFPDKPSETIQFTDFQGGANTWNYVPGDSMKSIAMPATSPEIIAVAGYTTRNSWNRGSGCCEVAFNLGAILDFSSSGPSADPSATGQKPEIAAPGGMIASALSSTATHNSLMIMPDGKHALQAGTSMAAPFVTGTIALMFSADSNYTHDDVKKYIVESAYVDEDVGEAPNNRWGFGKLDVLAALETAINGGSSGRFDGNQSLSEPEGAGASGGSLGCTLSSEVSGSDKKIVLAGMFFIAAALIAARRRSMR
ncbi:MAG TPA: S8 family serine peptidase [bacterium]|nr:S8 family serine peptidase [bacterium]